MVASNHGEAFHGWKKSSVVQWCMDHLTISLENTGEHAKPAIILLKHNLKCKYSKRACLNSKPNRFFSPSKNGVASDC